MLCFDMWHIMAKTGALCSLCLLMATKPTAKSPQCAMTSLVKLRILYADWLPIKTMSSQTFAYCMSFAGCGLHSHHPAVTPVYQLPFYVACGLKSHDYAIA